MTLLWLLPEKERFKIAVPAWICYNLYKPEGYHKSKYALVLYAYTRGGVWNGRKKPSKAGSKKEESRKENNSSNIFAAFSQKTELNLPAEESKCALL